MGAFTPSERDCILALSEISIAHSNLEQKFGIRWRRDISGLYRMKIRSAPAALITMEIAKADQHPVIDSALVDPVASDPVPFCGYLFSALYELEGSRNKALAKPFQHNDECRFSFVATLGGHHVRQGASGLAVP